MKRLLLIALLSLFTVSCTDESSSREVLTGAGYTQINFTGYEFWSCAKDDTYHTGFTAKGPSGVQVKGVVCCGLFFKGCTIRF